MFGLLISSAVIEREVEVVQLDKYVARAVRSAIIRPSHHLKFLNLSILNK